MEADHVRRRQPFLLKQQDIYTIKQKLKEVQQRGTTDAQSVLEHLHEQLIPYRAQVDRGDKNRLVQLFVTEPMSIALARKYGYVIHIDSTFRTNQYDMPLLHIVSSTATKKTFTLAFAFLAGKHQEHVVWALQKLKEVMGDLPTVAVVTDEEIAIRNALDIVFPGWRQILCRWHMSNTVKGKGYGESISRAERENIVGQFWGIMQANTEDAFDRLRGELALHCLDSGNSAIENVGRFVMRKLELAQHFASYRLADVLHLNELSISRIEGHHRVLKQNLPKGTQGLLGVVSHFLNTMRISQTALFDSHHDCMDKAPTNRPKIFGDVSS